MIYSQEILKSTLEVLGRDELADLIEMLKEKTPYNNFSDFGLTTMLETAEEVLHEANLAFDEAHDDE